METRTEQRLLVAGTWALALVTLYLALDAHWSSEKQLQAYVYVNPREAFHIDGQETLQVYSIVGNSGLTPATNVQRFAGILPPTDTLTQRTVREAGHAVTGDPGTFFAFDASGNPIKVPPFTAITLPGDALTGAGSPPAAAHGMARKLFSSYSGPLFQVRRKSDNATQDIYAASDGWADMASLFTFLGTSDGAVSKLYDQTIYGNTFSQTTNANQPGLLIKYLPNGRPIPTALTLPGQYFRLRTGTTAIPTGANPITVTAVFCPVVTSEPDGTIGFYGDMEATVSDTGNGHMFALAWGSSGGWRGGSGSGPWIGTDWENGIYASSTGTGNTTAPVQLADFIFALAKTDGSTTWVLKGGPAASPNLETLYSGGLPSGYTANFEGGISLGEGGDGSISEIVFVEGMIIPSMSTDAADQAIQTNLAQSFPTF